LVKGLSTGKITTFCKEVKGFITYDWNDEILKVCSNPAGEGGDLMSEPLVDVTDKLGIRKGEVSQKQYRVKVTVEVEELGQ
jgi:hypothetical protein